MGRENLGSSKFEKQTFGLYWKASSLEKPFGKELVAAGRWKNRARLGKTANRVQNQAIRSAWQSEAVGSDMGSGKLPWPREEVSL